MNAGHYLLLAYALIFVPMLLVRPLWPFRLKRFMPAPPESVWNLLKDTGTTTFTFPQVEKLDIRRDPDDSSILYCTAYLKRRRKPYRYVAQLVASKPFEFVACEYLNSERTRTFGRCEYRLSPDGSGTQVEFRARARVSGIVGIVSTWRAYRSHLKQLAVLAEWA